MTNILTLITILTTLTCCTSCATFKPSTLIGASIGATLGCFAGTAIGSPNHPIRGALIGAGVGASAGGFSGYLIDAVTDKQNVTPKFDRPQKESKLPAMSMPEASCVELPSRIEGNKFYKKHEVCTIEKGAVWMME